MIVSGDYDHDVGVLINWVCGVMWFLMTMYGNTDFICFIYRLMLSIIYWTHLRTSLLHLLIVSLLPIITSPSTIITSSSSIIIIYLYPWITSSLSRLLGQRNVIYIFFVLALWKATGVYEVFFALTSFVHYFRWTWTEWGILWWMDGWMDGWIDR